MALLIACLALGGHPIYFVLLLYLSPIVFIVSLFVFGWLLVGPYRPNAHLTGMPATRTPMPSRSGAAMAETGGGALAATPPSRMPAAPRTPTIKPIASRR